MKSYDYIKNDAFTSKGSSGNPAACIYLKEGEALGEDLMQAIAAEHKGFVSEVIYCTPLGSGAAAPDGLQYPVVPACWTATAKTAACKQDIPRYRLRYYSSECEVDFCGHGTIACLHYLAQNEPKLRHCKEIGISTVKGDLIVYNELQDLDAVFITAPEPKYLPLPQTSVKAGTPCAKLTGATANTGTPCTGLTGAKEKAVTSCAAFTGATVATALGLKTEALDNYYSMEFIDAGLRTMILPIRELDDILRLHPDEASLKEFCLAHGIDIILVFCVRVADSKNKLRSRVFAPKFGYLEDKATGSGNSALGYYMLKHGMWQGEPVSIEQNGERKHYNIVRLKTLAGKVLFGGGATVKIKGSYFI